MPALLVADVLSIELLVHAWDLAQATGVKLVVSDELAAYVLELANELISTPLRSGGRFGPALPIDDDVDSLTKLVAFTGRQA